MGNKDNAEEQGAAILAKLDALAGKMESMERELAAIKSGVEQTHARAATMLYAFIMSRMSPKILDQIIPALDESYFTDDPWSMTGVGVSKPAKWLRESVSRALMNTGFATAAFPFSEGKKLMRRAIDTTTYEERGHIFRYYFSYLLLAGLYNWRRILPECEDYEHNAGRWVPGQEYAWCVCIAAHGENGDMRKAADLVEKFRKAYDSNNLLLLPEAAYYAVAAGVKDERLALGAWVFEEAKKNREENLLSEMLANKSIAMVGGGPQERGKGRGREIDAHDIVFRINHHARPEAAADYGGKTDIFGTGTLAQSSTPYTGNERVVAFLGRSSPFEVLTTRLDRIAMMRRDGVRIIIPSQDDWAGVVMDPELCCTYTRGLCAILLVKKYRPDLSTDDLYGFSHAERFRDGYNHLDSQIPYYYQYPYVWYHNMGKEVEDFHSLFEK